MEFKGNESRHKSMIWHESMYLLLLLPVMMYWARHIHQIVEVPAVFIRDIQLEGRFHCQGSTVHYGSFSIYVLEPHCNKPLHHWYSKSLVYEALLRFSTLHLRSMYASSVLGYGIITNYYKLFEKKLISRLKTKMEDHASSWYATFDHNMATVHQSNLRFT